MSFVIPPKSQVGVFNPADIGEEDSRAVRIDGDKEEWNPPALQSAFPDWSKVPQLRKYFGRKGGSVYPAWLFHPTKPDKLVNSADEAEKLGVFYREATVEERGQFGIQSLWDWERGEADLKWRPYPQQRKKLDPANLETGKIYAPAAASSSPNVESLVAAVTASVLAAMKTSAAPSHINSKEWEEFQAFQAFKKTTEAVSTLVDGDDREALIADAEEMGIKIDKRWSTERLKSEIQAKAA